MRYLREYSYVAHKNHFCDSCFMPIIPGEQYRGTVYATDKRIVVIKEHDPPCELPPDPDEERFFKNVERMIEEKSFWSMAA